MKAAIFLHLIVLSISIVGQVPELRLQELRVTKESGTEAIYTNATLTKVDPDGLRFAHDAGTIKVPYEKLPKELRERFTFDLEAVAEYRQTTNAANAQAAVEASNIKADLAKDAQAKKKLRELLASSKVYTATVVSVTDDGIIATLLETRGGGFLAHGALHVTGELPDRLYDGASFRIQAVENGTFSYVSAAGAKRTVRSLLALSNDAKARK